MSDEVKKEQPVYVFETPEQKLLRVRGEFPATIIDPYEIDYTLDDEKKCLVETGKRNVNDLIQSYADCALDKILDQYLDNVDDRLFDDVIIDTESEPFDVSVLTDKLEDNLQASMYFDSLIEKYGLDSSLSKEDVLKKIKDENSKYIEKLNQFANDLEKQNLDKKEEDHAQKEIKQENEQEKL